MNEYTTEEEAPIVYRDGNYFIKQFKTWHEPGSAYFDKDGKYRLRKHGEPGTYFRIYLVVGSAVYISLEGIYSTKEGAIKGIEKEREYANRR